MDEKQAFREEAVEILDSLETDLLELRRDRGDQVLIGKIFRSLHTLKGSGAMFGFDRLAHFTHQVEDVVDEIRRDQFPLSETLLDLFLSSRDHILALLLSAPPSASAAEEERTLLAKLASHLRIEGQSEGTAVAPRQNCWEFFQCQKEQRCPAGIHKEFTGMNSGHCGGRICWVVTGTRCKGGRQGGYFEKFHQHCKDCAFRLLVKKEEGRNLSPSVAIYRTLREINLNAKSWPGSGHDNRLRSARNAP